MASSLNMREAGEGMNVSFLRKEIMKLSIALAMLCSSFLIPASFAQVPAQSPKAVRINVSPDTVSRLTETPAGDYWIEDSQIFIGGRGNASRWFGLSGAAVDMIRNENAAGGASTTLRIKFDRILLDAFAALEKRNALPETKFISSNDSFDAKLLPQARFFIEDDGQVRLTFRLTARMKEEGASSEVTKNYNFTVTGLRPFVGAGGWADNNAELVRSESMNAFERLAEAFAFDVSGRFAEASLPAKQRIVTLTSIASGKSSRAFLLGQSEKTVMIMPMIRDKPIRDMVMVIDKTAFRIDGL